MRTYDRNAVKAAFTTVARLVDRNERVVFSKLGLSSAGAVAFKDAITHSFTAEKDGFTLNRIFKIKDGKWIRCEYANNPMGEEFVDRLLMAMAYCRKWRMENRQAKKTETPVLSSYKVEDLLTELTRRGYIVNLIAK